MELDTQGFLKFKTVFTGKFPIWQDGDYLEVTGFFSSRKSAKKGKLEDLRHIGDGQMLVIRNVPTAIQDNYKTGQEETVRFIEGGMYDWMEFSNHDRVSLQELGPGLVIDVIAKAVTVPVEAPLALKRTRVLTTSNPQAY